MNSLRRGFTLIEMMVIAPIVILLIGSFIALIVNLTGEVLSSRGSNSLTYDIQDALNRIEDDVKLSTTYLAVNNVSLTTTKQGFGTNTVNGSTTNFTNIQKSGGSNASLILNGLVTNGNPMSTTTGLVYLADKPSSCATFSEYSKNTPMTMNVVYFVDVNNVLWRRVLMRSDYDTASIRCGTAAPWQQPSCIVGYTPATMPFCRTNDVRLLDGVAPSDFVIQYFASADSTTADSTANNPTITNDTTRNTALQSTPTVSISIISRKNIAGRDISGAGSIRVTRLDTNASSIAVEAAPTSAPEAPSVSASVSDGHNVTFTWPRVSGAASYDLDYRINNGAWQNNPSTTDMNNNTRTYTVTSGTHTDTVEARVRATNSFGDSTYGSTSLAIPLWAPLILKNGWTDYNATFSTAAYTKTKSGVVVLKGLVKSGAGVIATLPADYKPEKYIMFANSSNQVVGRLDVLPNGDINLSVGSNAWFSLDGAAYLPAGTAFTNLAYQNSWASYNTTYWDPAGYATDASGRVHLRGLVSSGNATPGVAIATIPAAILSPEYTHWAEISNNTITHISSAPANSAILTKGGANPAFLSINAIYYPASRASGTSCTTQWCDLPLINNWVYYGAPYAAPKFTKGSDGMVSIKGLIRAGTATDMAIVPAGYCPKQRLIMTVVTADVWGRVDIVPWSGGTCLVTGSAYSTTWVSLDSIRYMAE